MASHNRTGCYRGPMRGDVCNLPMNACDKFTGLTCSNGRCICNGNWFDSLCHSEKSCRDRGQKYNPTTGRCQLKLRSRCNATSECPNQATCANSEFPWNQCQCGPDFKETADQECAPNKMFDQMCSGTNAVDGDECSQEAGLQCVNNRCACAGRSQWDSQEKSCRREHGAVCKVQVHMYEKDSQFCRRNSECKNGICGCMTGFTVDSVGNCYGNYLSDCSSSGDCKLGLICYDGLCKCPKLASQTYAYASEYGSNEQICLGNIGGACSSTERCFPGYACVNGTCRCEPGSSPTVAGKCLKSFGSPCAHKECNHEEGFGCVDGRCSCAGSDLKYIPGKGCRAKPGSTCGKIDTVGSCGSFPGRYCGRDSYKVECQEPALCTELSTTVSKCI